MKEAHLNKNILAYEILRIVKKNLHCMADYYFCIVAMPKPTNDFDSMRRDVKCITQS